MTGFKEMSLNSVHCLLLLLALPLLRGGIAQQSCDEDESDLMYEEWRNCTDEFKQEYAVAVERAQRQAEVEVAICRMLQGLVEECGNLWARCQSDQQVREMKDLYMANLMRNNNGSENSLDDCPIVIRFRLNEEEEEDLCTQDELQDAQAKFQRCSHQITTTLVDQQETGGIGECPGLQPIRQKCSPALLQCMRPEEAERVLEVHLEQVASRWPALVDCAAEQKEGGGGEVVEDIGSKVEREALDDGGEAVDGHVKEEEEQAEGGVVNQENATGKGEEKLGRQNTSDIGKEGGQLDQKGGGGVEKSPRGEGEAEQSALKGGEVEQSALRGGGEVEQSALRGGGEVEQSALRGGGESQERAAALVLAAALCYHLLL